MQEKYYLLRTFTNGTVGITTWMIEHKFMIDLRQNNDEDMSSTTFISVSTFDVVLIKSSRGIKIDENFVRF